MGNLFGEVCENGHILNYGATSSGMQYCYRCPPHTKVLTRCPNCGEPIRVGGTTGEEVCALETPDFYPPRSCPYCGEEFVWYRRYLANVKAAIHDAPNLSAKDIQTLDTLINKMSDGTPCTPREKERFQKILGKAGESTKELVYSLIRIFFTELVNKFLSL